MKNKKPKKKKEKELIENQEFNSRPVKIIGDKKSKSSKDTIEFETDQELSQDETPIKSKSKKKIKISFCKDNSHLLKDIIKEIKAV